MLCNSGLSCMAKLFKGVEGGCVINILQNVLGIASQCPWGFGGMRGDACSSGGGVASLGFKLN